MKLTLEDIIDMQEGLKEVRQNPDLFGDKFSYACAKNRRAIRDPFDTIVEFEEDRGAARKKMIEEMAKKDEDGKCVSVQDGGNFGLELASPECHLRLAESDAAWQKMHRQKLKEYVEVKIHMVEQKDLPKKLPTGIFDKIFPMISFPDEQQEAAEPEED